MYHPKYSRTEAEDFVGDYLGNNLNDLSLQGDYSEDEKELQNQGKYVTCHYGKTPPKEKKKVIVTLGKHFPGTHPRKGEPTNFAESIANGKKIHTIRYNNMDKKGKSLWLKRAKDINDGLKYLSVREWSGRPYNSEQVEIIRYEKIGLQIVTIYRKKGEQLPTAVINGKEIPIEQIAANDGLSVEDFVNWFFSQGEDVFCGAIVHFTDFRY